MLLYYYNAPKMNFSIKDFFSKCDQLRIWSHLLKKSLMENFNFCAVLEGIRCYNKTLLLLQITQETQMFFGGICIFHYFVQPMIDSLNQTLLRSALISETVYTNSLIY